MIRQQGLLLLCISLLLASACDNSKRFESCQGYVKMSQMVKDFFLFQDSSYWIYVDSFSGATDSVYISEFRKEDLWPHKVVGTRNCPCYESYFYNIHSTFLDLQSVKLQAYFRQNPVDLAKANFVYSITLANSSKKEDRFMTIGYDSFSSETPVIGGYISKQDSFTVRGKTFGETLRLFYPSHNPFDWVKEIYYTRNVGVTKYLDYNGRIWELSHYKMKQ